MHPLHFSSVPWAWQIQQILLLLPPWPVPPVAPSEAVASFLLLEDAGGVLPHSWDLLVTCPGPTSIFSKSFAPRSSSASEMSIFESLTTEASKESAFLFEDIEVCSTSSFSFMDK